MKVDGAVTIMHTHQGIIISYNTYDNINTYKIQISGKYVNELISKVTELIGKNQEKIVQNGNVAVEKEKVVQNGNVVVKKDENISWVDEEWE